MPCSCRSATVTLKLAEVRTFLCSFGVIMWEVVTREIPVRGALRTIEVPQEAPEEVSVDIRTRPCCQSIRPWTLNDSLSCLKCPSGHSIKAAVIDAPFLCRLRT